MKIIIFKMIELVEELKKLSIQPLFIENELQTQVDDYDVLFMPSDEYSMELAKKIKEIKTKLNIIFVSDDSSLCFSAMEMHASGFLLKPVTAVAIQKELENLRYGTYSRVFIRCFGEFDVIGDGVSIPFRRKKCKELLAYLVYRNGNTVSMDELCNVLFHEVSNKKTTYLYVLKCEIIRTLKPYGLENVIKYQNNGFIVDLKLMECDYIQYLEGKKSLYQDEFMSQYKWADKIEEK